MANNRSLNESDYSMYADANEFTMNDSTTTTPAKQQQANGGGGGMGGATPLGGGNTAEQQRLTEFETSLMSKFGGMKLEDSTKKYSSNTFRKCDLREIGATTTSTLDGPGSPVVTGVSVSSIQIGTPSAPMSTSSSSSSSSKQGIFAQISSAFSRSPPKNQPPPLPISEPPTSAQISSVTSQSQVTSNGTSNGGLTRMSPPRTVPDHIHQNNLRQAAIEQQNNLNRISMNGSSNNDSPVALNQTNNLHETSDLIRLTTPGPGSLASKTRGRVQMNGNTNGGDSHMKQIPESRHLLDMTLAVGNILNDRSIDDEAREELISSLQAKVDQLEAQLAKALEESRLHQAQATSENGSVNKLHQLLLDVTDLSVTELKGTQRERNDMAREVTELQQTIHNQAEDIQGVEKSFEELHRRYGKLKQALEYSRSAEEAAKTQVQLLTDQLADLQARYEVDVKQRKPGVEQELIQLRTMVKRAEMKIKGLESSLEQKTSENQELQKMVDDLIGQT